MLEGILSHSSDESGDEITSTSDGEDSVEGGNWNGYKASSEHGDGRSFALFDGDKGASVMNTATYHTVSDANGGERYVYEEINPVYDSDDTDAQEPANTIGNISLSYYDSYPHIGYDINGKKIMRPATAEALDALLDSIELPKGWTGLTDPQTGKPLNLTQDELELLRRLQTGLVPEEGYDPYPVRS